VGFKVSIGNNASLRQVEWQCGAVAFVVDLHGKPSVPLKVYAERGSSETTKIPRRRLGAPPRNRGGSLWRRPRHARSSRRGGVRVITLLEALRKEYARAKLARAGDSGAVKSSAGSHHGSFAVGSSAFLLLPSFSC
jgi:hypothetical protein